MTGFSRTEFLRQKDQAMTIMHVERYETTTEDTSFCTKSKHAMSMYMDGFHFSLSSVSSDNTTPLSCLNLFISSWTLSTRLRFFLALILVTALGISIEGLTTYKIKLATSEFTTSSSSQDKIRRFHRKFIPLSITFLNFLQALISYLLMLSVMTYSIELLLCAALGYALGHRLFDSKKQSYLKIRSNISVLNNNPCHLEFGDDDIVGNSPKIKNRTTSEDKDKTDDADSATDHETMGLLSRRSGSFL